MKCRVKTALGIDIGDRRISVAVVEKTDHGIRVVAAAAGDLPRGEVPGHRSSPGKALSRILRKLGGCARTGAVRVAVTTSARSVILRLLELPKPMPGNLAEFVETELKQYVAMSGRRMSSDYCGIGSGARKRLLAVAADATEVAETLEICGDAGVAVNSVEPAALACVRALLVTDSQLRRGPALIGALTRSSLILCLFSNGTLDFVRIRDLAAGGDAPDLLRAWLCDELNAVLRYSNTELTGEAPQWQARLVLCDAGMAKECFADLPALEPGVKTLVVHDAQEPLLTLSDGKMDSVPPSLPAVGAALKVLDVEGDELRIDLTPEEVVQAHRSSRRGWIVANAAAGVFLAVFLLVQILAWTADAMNRRIEQNRITGQLHTMPTKIAQDRFVEGELLRMTRELASLEPVRSRREVDWSGMLHSIGQAAPTGVCLTHVACDDSQSVQLKGMALSNGHAKAFVQNLDVGTSFTSVRLTRLQRRQATGEIVEYEIDCVLKPICQEYLRAQGS
ncbi:MAG TPA: pilus assembly protein PilM [Sedimentisphaerales bacterium]|nr:pilus assembly protein PilM [Sedimentisphaerales bacterium]